MSKPHERFRAWQLGHDLVLAVYRATSGWPMEERFGLVTQARRAAVSAQLNLVEGAAGRGPGDFARFLDNANGSLADLEYALRLARDLGHIGAQD
ncbi:MAG: four helix bundle protein [Gemmatimonadales bacterium]